MTWKGKFAEPRFLFSVIVYHPMKQNATIQRCFQLKRPKVCKKGREVACKRLDLQDLRNGADTEPDLYAMRFLGRP